jgi:hypothetical protein
LCIFLLFFADTILRIIIKEEEFMNIERSPQNSNTPIESRLSFSNFDEISLEIDPSVQSTTKKTIPQKIRAFFSRVSGSAEKSIEMQGATPEEMEPLLGKVSFVKKESHLEHAASCTSSALTSAYRGARRAFTYLFRAPNFSVSLFIEDNKDMGDTQFVEKFVKDFHMGGYPHTLFSERECEELLYLSCSGLLNNRAPETQKLISSLYSASFDSNRIKQNQISTHTFKNFNKELETIKNNSVFNNSTSPELKEMFAKISQASEYDYTVLPKASFFDVTDNLKSSPIDFLNSFLEGIDFKVNKGGSINQAYVNELEKVSKHQDLTNDQRDLISLLVKVVHDVNEYTNTPKEEDVIDFTVEELKEIINKDLDKLNRFSKNSNSFLKNVISQLQTSTSY